MYSTSPPNLSLSNHKRYHRAPRRWPRLLDLPKIASKKKVTKNRIGYNLIKTISDVWNNSIWLCHCWYLISCNICQKKLNRGRLCCASSKGCKPVSWKTFGSWFLTGFERRLLLPREICNILSHQADHIFSFGHCFITDIDFLLSVTILSFFLSFEAPDLYRYLTSFS